ncbi:MAG: DUF2490 domain-containing protein [Methylobacter sp.]|nr:DUF2490 domain-containing protein [Methylobacter sp.]MDP2099069.1 DUF2490 domain-containing protein [Methylobacter sp.]MDP2429478.1 DUF2490 domain-containing protein [Methylobacter sp.]MDP3055484.1 DUF2490 domain-containing protein [Methylobacter sp.]MDP3361864.1 DUF2490 domain-containing protein [Methylobacter sp.]
MLKKLPTSLIAAFLLIFTNVKTVQAGSLEDFHTWGTLTATGSLSPVHADLSKFRYWLEGQGRFGDDSSRFSQGILRAGLGYAVTDTTSLWLGYGWIPSEQPIAAVPFEENRIWQQLLWNKQYELGTFSSRSRFEQRFMGIGNDVGWRFRQLLKASVPLRIIDHTSFVISDEYFVDINKTDWKADNGFDQNRLFVGIGYAFDAHAKTEIGYMNQYINKLKGPHALNHILSVNFYLNY